MIHRMDPLARNFDHLGQLVSAHVDPKKSAFTIYTGEFCFYW
jgi:hypothetical protein